MFKENGVRSVPTAIQKAREGEFLRPSTDVYETPEAYVITIDMPGVSRDSAQVRVEGNSLVVKGTLEERTGKSSDASFAEPRKDGYRRVFNLGDGIDRNTIDARHEDGVLTVKLLKKEEAKPREIGVR